MISRRVLIVDDEPLARRRLRRLLDGRGDLSVAAECGDGLAALRAIEDQRPDLIFLDVQMPGLDGMEVLEQAHLSPGTAVVFVTAYDRYALEAFDHHAVDYLLKPFTDRRFESALERARGRLRRRDAEERSQRLLAAVKRYRSAVPASDPSSGAIPTPGAYRIAVRSTGKTRFVRHEEIDWVEAAGSYVRLHTLERSWLLRETMTRIENQLPSRDFVRVHRSAIVRIERVEEVESLTHGEMILTLRGGARVKLSRTYRDRAATLLGRSQDGSVDSGVAFESD